MAAASAGGCASTRAPSGHATAALPGADACVFIRNIDDWVVIDPTTLIVHAPPRKDAYLLKLFAPLPDLDFKECVGFEDSDHNGQLCGLGDDLVVHDQIGA